MGPSREGSPQTLPTSPWLRLLETPGEVRPKRPWENPPSGREEGERNGDYPVQRLGASLPETGALSSKN